MMNPRSRARLTALLALTALCALALPTASLASSHSLSGAAAVRAVTRLYLYDVYTGNDTGACDQLTSACAQRITEESGHANCPMVFKDRVLAPSHRQAAAVANRQIAHSTVTITGRKASCRVPYVGSKQTLTYFLTRENHRWLISDIFAYI
jgi:hypothetical protein